MDAVFVVYRVTQDTEEVIGYYSTGDKATTAVYSLMTGMGWERLSFNLWFKPDWETIYIKEIPVY